ncbi:hypothetical protein [Thermococcus sp.]|uniref:hypothetical protein n=1 Tax=Thermococcus sp. TaxID=35749 RepID=UPI0026194C6A|nr:hypothetical protein [Thermococcus sp.]
MSCGELEELVKRLALAFVVLFVSGFLVLYYEVRKVACSQGLCDSGSAHRTPLIYSAYMLAIVFSAIFVAFIAYISTRGRG